MIDPMRLLAAYEKARLELLSHRVQGSHWVGRLSTSALSTATAISALTLVDRRKETGAGQPSGRFPAGELLRQLASRGILWLAEHQNADGGWGDTEKSHSNIATTLLARAAFAMSGAATAHETLMARSEAYVAKQGDIPALRRRYGKDKTFAVPILTNCALAGMVPWRDVSPLPFEWACLPQRFYRFFGLPVVSYAIPALVAIGQARYVHSRPRNPLVSLIRALAIDPGLKVLERMQPASGGFLEAVPLTSFVVMSLASSGQVDHAVVRKGVEFLVASVLPDGSWPIDTDLATWNTTLAINALSRSGEDVAELISLDWLLACQHRAVHAYTGARPGGWGWSDRSGAVPDVDDTSGALLALAALRRSAAVDSNDGERIDRSARNGIGWLLELQNRDGGWPTFCRGWGHLPFDRSGADLTAHALRALHAWKQVIPSAIYQRVVRSGFAYLAREQQAGGSWIPLWFGNQDHEREENPVYGTARVLQAYSAFGRQGSPAALRALDWLRASQNPDGGWGACQGGAPAAIGSGSSSVEETALAIEAMLLADRREEIIEPDGGDRRNGGDACDGRDRSAWGGWAGPGRAGLEKGLRWLVSAVETGEYVKSTPIGFYFAKLWYYESLYPVVFTVSALSQAVCRDGRQPGGSRVRRLAPAEQPWAGQE